MKHRDNIMIILAVIMAVMSSCERMTSDRYGFDLPVGPLNGCTSLYFY